MYAKERLYLTADQSKLVREGDGEGATLYAAPGDEIPDSAVARFGLVDGTIGAEGLVLFEIGEDDLIRVRLLSLADSPIIVSEHLFGHEYRGFGDGQLDEAQLLAILKEPRLEVLAALVETSPVEFVPFPGRDRAVVILQERVNDDILSGRPHLLLGAKEAAPPPDKEKAPGEDKEKKPDGDKGAGSGTKGAGTPEPAVGDDLKKLKHVGAKSAAALVKFGITTFAQVAAIDPAAPPAVEGLGAATNWAGVVASAKELVAKAASGVTAAETDQGAGAASGDGGAGAGDTDQVGA